MHVGVTRAYFYANAIREIYVRLPVEDQHEGEECTCPRRQITALVMQRKLGRRGARRQSAS